MPRTRRTVADAPSTGYGEKAELEAQVAALPPSAPPLPDPVPLGSPSGRPSEPVQAGLPMGPGPGPEALVTGRAADPQLDRATLAALYARFPSRTIRRLMGG